MRSRSWRHALMMSAPPELTESTRHAPTVTAFGKSRSSTSYRSSACRRRRPPSSVAGKAQPAEAASHPSPGCPGCLCRHPTAPSRRRDRSQPSCVGASPPRLARERYKSSSQRPVHQCPRSGFVLARGDGWSVIGWSVTERSQPWRRSSHPSCLRSAMRLPPTDRDISRTPH